MSSNCSSLVCRCDRIKLSLPAAASDVASAIASLLHDSGHSAPASVCRSAYYMRYLQL